MTTIDSITAAQIEQLRTEAAEAGDMEQVRLCDRAIVAYGEWREVAITESGMMAVRACARAISDSEAMAAEGK